MKGKHPRQKALLIVLVVFAVCLSQMAWTGGFTAAAQTPTVVRPAQALPDGGDTVKVGYLRTLSFGPIFVALEQGYFAEQGLKVELQEFRSGADMIAFLGTGALDMGGGEVGTALFNAIGNGLDVRAVASVSSVGPDNPASPLLVRKDLFESGQVTKPADLKGKKILLNARRGITEYTLSEYLALGGLTVDDIEIVTVPFADMPAALANKAVDAVLAAPPFAARIMDDGHAAVLLTGKELSFSPQVSALYFGKPLLDPANREVGVRFLTAYLKGARDLYGERWRTDENLAILNKYTGVPVPAIQKSVPFYCDPNGQINTASVEKIQNYYIGRGYTESTKPIALSQVIDETFAADALERLGRFKP